MMPSFVVIALAACGTPETTDTDDSEDTELADTEGSDTDAGPVDSLIDPALFTASNLEGSSVVDCTLTDGTVTTCYELVFGANPVDKGPFCPATTADVGGLGVYDGATDPGLRVMNAQLWADMEADGYDIVDEDGNVTVVDPGAGGMGPPPGGGPPGFGPPGGGSPGNACLQATPDDALTLTFTIPTAPSMLATPDTIERVEHIGVSVDGVPLTGDPPAAVNDGSVAIPAIDPCGCHDDPSGYYHWHFAAEVMNTVLSSVGISEVSCTNMAQDADALVGFARDGHPIYGTEDADGAPDDLDRCNGHTSATADFSEEVYHYHATGSDVPNLPPCVVGAHH